MGAVANYRKQVEQFEAAQPRIVAPVPLKKGRPPIRFRRDFDAAKIDRITGAQPRPITTGDMELRNSLASMRAVSRELERNNDYAKKYLSMLEIGVIGKDGFTLQNRARDLSGVLDKKANQIIEAEWKLFCKKGNCTVDGLMSFLGAKKVVLRSTARDGETLVRIVRGFKNPWKFALQLLEGDVLDEQLNISDGPSQNLIKMGIEYNEWGRPIAYHIREKHPGDYFGSQKSANTYKRVPANAIIHVFRPERPTQGRGIPWMRTAARRMNILGEYEYAELVAARIGASKMGFYVPNPEGGADIVPDDEDEEGNPIQEAEPGVFEKLPSGYNDFKTFMPEHPTGNYGPYTKEVKRGMSSGLGVAYNGLANDLEGVNFSSLRSGVLEERDNWREIQNWFIESFVDQVRAAWLEMLLLTNRTNLPYAKYDKFNAAEWRGRSFDWVDPEKDINADLAAIRGGLKTRSQVVAERGMDLEDIYEQLEEEEKLAKLYHLNLDMGGTAIKPGPKENQPEAGGAGGAQE